MTLTHLNAKGEANMVDVGDKAMTSRTAIADFAIQLRVRIKPFAYPHTSKTAPSVTLYCARVLWVQSGFCMALQVQMMYYPRRVLQLHPRVVHLSLFFM